MVVLDANILIRAVLGRTVGAKLRTYANRVQFHAPAVAFEEARRHLPRILPPGVSAETAFETLATIARIVDVVPEEAYAPLELAARERIERRDPDDWPVLAAALALNCPIWTEDQDFFGCGVATWTTDRVEIYLATFIDRAE